MALRILLVEDNPERITWFAERCPPDIRLVVARQAGGAMGLLARDPPGTYAGIMLDYDLGGAKNGADVARAVVHSFRTPGPALVHTNSPGGGAAIARILDAAGFELTRVVFEELTDAAFAEWLMEVREAQEEM